jgi:20S proteasome subunit alpha 7
MTMKEAVKAAARIIYIAHEDSKDKEFELEMTWVGLETEGRHQEVPKALREEAEQLAKKALDDDDDDDDEKDKMEE